MHLNEPIITTLKVARRLIVAVVGFTLLLGGVALIFLPGPAIIVIPLGLAVLASEFVWARLLLERVKSHFPASAKKVASKARDETVSGA